VRLREGSREGGHWLHPSHPTENPSLQQLCQVLCFPSQQHELRELFSSSSPERKKMMLVDVAGELHLLQYLSIHYSCKASSWKANKKRKLI